MQWSFGLIFNSILLGIGLAMDAFSVSLANGLGEPDMKKRKICLIAGVFAFFQALMPMCGWFLVHTIADKFQMFKKFIPWIALILLLYIGIEMIVDGVKKNNEKECKIKKLGSTVLIIQGIATSIDALSVGFTISDYNAVMALAASVIIAAVTFVICVCGVVLGKRCGTRFSDKSSFLGGGILIFIGIEIFLKGIF